MKRDEMLARMTDFKGRWDFIVIGGGATGMGIAIDAASRGYRPLLLEQGDFARGTSSRSTKLIHGGIRYLKKGNISLVLESLKERELLLANAPHLVHPLAFIIPHYKWWERPFYGAGLKLYDLLARTRRFRASSGLSGETTRRLLPTIAAEGLRGGHIYYDGQFDDARLIIHMAQTAAQQGAVLLNYVKVIQLTKSTGKITGVIAQDMESGKEYEIKAKAVINATGIFADSIRKMDDRPVPAIIKPSRGVHLVLDSAFLPGGNAVMVPHTDDGRLFFAIPWHNRVIVGTTDTPVAETPLEPCPTPEEIRFLLSHAARYLTPAPTARDVLSIFAGLRPLVRCGKNQSTADLSRKHAVFISASGLVTIVGGKWTTYRKMAEDTVNRAAMVAQLNKKPCVSAQLRIHGYHTKSETFGPLAHYGSDAPRILALQQENPEYREPLHPRFPYTAAEVIWAIRHEMAVKLEDILSRRTRALILDAAAGMELAPKVAAIMAKEMGKNNAWQKEEIKEYRQLARGYLIT